MEKDYQKILARSPAWMESSLGKYRTIDRWGHQIASSMQAVSLRLSASTNSLSNYFPGYINLVISTI